MMPKSKELLGVTFLDSLRMCFFCTSNGSSSFLAPDKLCGVTQRQLHSVACPLILLQPYGQIEKVWSITLWHLFSRAEQLEHCRRGHTYVCVVPSRSWYVDAAHNWFHHECSLFIGEVTKLLWSCGVDLVVPYPQTVRFGRFCRGDFFPILVLTFLSRSVERFLSLTI